MVATFDSTKLADGARITDEECEILASIPQTTLVRNHLIRFKRITDKVARDVYGITRLSDVIYKLRYKLQPNMWIVTEDTESVNRFGKTVKYATYVYKGDI